MSNDKQRSPSRHFDRRKPEYQSTIRPYLFRKGWYEPEELATLQQLFDGLWLLLRQQVFPWDVEASREQLAIQLFKSIPGANGQPEQLKQEVLSLWQIQQVDLNRSGNIQRKAWGSKTDIVTPIYDPQHLPAP